MDNQVWIKIILIAAFVVLSLILVIPRSGARPLAIRRLIVLLVLIASIAAVIFPEWINGLAQLLGVGRGTDLLLYTLAVVFAGNAIVSRTRQLKAEQRTTELAREIALMKAPPPPMSPPRGSPVLNGKDE